MSRKFKIQVLAENSARKQELLAEHGLAYWIEFDNQCVLFDTGQGFVLPHNAERLRVDLSRANSIVLSHGHYDHTGGLLHAFNLAPQSRVFLHPQAMIQSFSGVKEKAREIGMPSTIRQALQKEEVRLNWTQKPTEVIPGVFVTGEIPRLTDYEDTGGEFYLDVDGKTPDPILDDQAIFMDTEKGVVIVLGCAHAGVVNTMDYIRQLTHRPIHAVIGGTHLLNASDQRLNRTLAAFRGMNIQIIAPGHCTGPKATAAFWTAYPDQITDCCVGTHWSFNK